MIEPGVIRRMGAYYRNEPEYKFEIARGLAEFYDDTRAIDNDNPLFNEWMAYDFRFSDGKRMLEKFYYENPLDIPLYRREIYKSLLENYYGFYDVLEVRRLSGLTIKRIADGREFDVSEVSATFDLDPGDVFVARVAMVLDHYELVGADSKVFKSSQAKSAKERTKFIKDLLTYPLASPKDTFRLHRSI